MATGREESTPTSTRAASWQRCTISVMKRQIRFRLNGRSTSLDTEDTRTLLWVLRTDLELTGTKFGCGQGICGACTVAVDGQAMRSCQTPLSAVDGKSVVTIEGLEKDGKLHPLQQAFIDH